jgi:hypothetical protein
MRELASSLSKVCKKFFNATRKMGHFVDKCGQVE